MSINITDRYYPDVTAVDPKGCGCTECLTGEYVPEEDWFRYARAGDVIALAVGNIRDNTDFGMGWLLSEYNYDNTDAQDAIQALSNLNL